MDFDGFLVQIRIELEGIERAAAPLWELAAGTEPGEGFAGLPTTAAGDHAG